MPNETTLADSIHASDARKNVSRDEKLDEKGEKKRATTTRPRQAARRGGPWQVGQSLRPAADETQRASAQRPNAKETERRQEEEEI